MAETLEAQMLAADFQCGLNFLAVLFSSDLCEVNNVPRNWATVFWSEVDSCLQCLNENILAEINALNALGKRRNERGRHMLR